MKIGIDAKWYFNGPPSGQVVVKNIVDELLIKDHKCDIYLFVDKKDLDKCGCFDSYNINIVPIVASPNLLSNFFIIPYWNWKLNLDIVIFQNFPSIFPISTKKIAIVYDVLFLDYPIYYSKAELIYLNPIKYLANKADQIVTISKSEKQRIIDYRIGTDTNTSVMYLGVDKHYKPLDQYSQEIISNFDKKYNLPSKYLLYVGRINIRKNLLNLLKAFNLLQDKVIKIIVVGKVDHKNIDINTYIEDNGLTSRVIFTGHIPIDDLYLFYAKSTVFCFPSFAEGFGLPPLEAMRCGVPVIVSNRTSLPEVCGDAGTYVEPDSPSDIAEKVDELLSDSSLYEEKRLASLKQSQSFTWENAANDLLNVIRKLS